MLGRGFGTLILLKLSIPQKLTWMVGGNSDNSDWLTLRTLNVVRDVTHIQ